MDLRDVTDPGMYTNYDLTTTSKVGGHHFCPYHGAKM